MARVLLFAFFLWPSAAVAQALAGTYVYQSPNGPVTLSLQEQGATLTGTMLGADGSTFTLQGTIENGRATGAIRVGDGAGWFAAGFVGNQLKLIVAELDGNGQPDLNNAWNLDFTRTGGAAPGALGAQPGNPSGSGGMGTAPDGVQQQNESSPMVREWLGHLRGRKLSYRESYSSNSGGGFGGYNKSWDAFLCSDGTFLFQQSSNVSIDTGGAFGHARGSGMNRGSWRIVEYGGQIVLQYQMEGSSPDYGVLTFQNGATYLDRSRVYVTNENPYCH